MHTAALDRVGECVTQQLSESVPVAHLRLNVLEAILSWLEGAQQLLDELLVLALSQHVHDKAAAGREERLDGPVPLHADRQAWRVE